MDIDDEFRLAYIYVEKNEGGGREGNSACSKCDSRSPLDSTDGTCRPRQGRRDGGCKKGDGGSTKRGKDDWERVEESRIERDREGTREEER